MGLQPKLRISVPGRLITASLYTTTKGHDLHLIYRPLALNHGHGVSPMPDVFADSKTNHHIRMHITAHLCHTFGNLSSTIIHIMMCFVSSCRILARSKYTIKSAYGVVIISSCGVTLHIYSYSSKSGARVWFYNVVFPFPMPVKKSWNKWIQVSSPKLRYLYCSYRYNHKCYL